MTDTKTALVISAHAADFVWRCGGAIALHESLGWDVTIVCLTFGERGESAGVVGGRSVSSLSDSLARCSR